MKIYFYTSIFLMFIPVFALTYNISIHITTLEIETKNSQINPQEYDHQTINENAALSTQRCLDPISWILGYKAVHTIITIAPILLGACNTALHLQHKTALEHLQKHVQSKHKRSERHHLACTSQATK